MFVYLIIINAILFVTGLLLGHLKNALIVCALTSTFYGFSSLFKTLVVKMEVFVDAEILRIRKMKLFKSWEEAYEIKKLICSFDEEIRSRGLKARVFRVKMDSKVIVEMIPSKDGWSEKKIKAILNSLKTQTG